MAKVISPVRVQDSPLLLWLTHITIFPSKIKLLALTSFTVPSMVTKSALPRPFWLPFKYKTPFRSVTVAEPK
jgi:hypothetical protein